MDGVYVIFILMVYHLSFFLYFFILEELYLMLHIFIIQILGSRPVHIRRVWKHLGLVKDPDPHSSRQQERASQVRTERLGVWPPEKRGGRRKKGEMREGQEMGKRDVRGM